LQTNSSEKVRGVKPVIPVYPVKKAGSLNALSFLTDA